MTPNRAFMQHTSMALRAVRPLRLRYSFVRRLGPHSLVKDFFVSSALLHSPNTTGVTLHLFPVFGKKHARKEEIIPTVSRSLHVSHRYRPIAIIQPNDMRTPNSFSIGLNVIQKFRGAYRSGVAEIIPVRIAALILVVEAVAG